MGAGALSSSDFGNNDTTDLRSFEFGANTPWYRTMFLRGRGTNATRRSKNSFAVNTIEFVPLLQALLNLTMIWLSDVSSSRDSEIGGRPMYRN